MWRSAGAAVTVTSVDFPVFQERLGQGRFDAYIGAWIDEPSARGLADQWTRQGWAALNYGHYANPGFDSLFARAEPDGERRRGGPRLPVGARHAERRRAGVVPVRPGQRGRGIVPGAGPGDQSVQLGERAAELEGRMS